MSSSALLDPAVIARAEALGLHARFVVEGYMAGEHKSPYHGFAAEFAQHRQYAHGDDIRHLDWKLLGRTDRHYVKQYEQETNYVAHIVLDGSASMNYASGEMTKLHYGKVLAACLTYLVLMQRDSAAVSLFDDGLREQSARSDSRESIHRVVTMLSRFEARNETNIGRALHQLAGQVRRKGIVIVVSDFLDDEVQALQGVQHLRFAGHEVIVFHLVDPYELEFPFEDIVEFDGLEQQETVLTRPADIRESYLRQFTEFNRRLREGCERNQCHYVQVNIAKPVTESLGSYLAFRLRVARY